ncbi:hypothetical protein QN277_024632 [Acacia crassicarpa]|uniref:TIR domain-containing protein n=1 Tax=Acacia crassicarpa TaxID=499986 RepID=A0AAE1MKE6_9FABA|nr:hypothetical protein QN277_024632 [Acacia crassicarpa]
MTSDQDASSSYASNFNSTPRTCKYDIFLSFRGEDTCKGFTDHLYHTLKGSGFSVFRDDEELERGEVISEELLQAIEDSHFAIVVLSKNYASSSWCLNELQHILDSRDNLCQQVFPIFYDVDPSNVRNQKGSFEKAFVGHQKLQRDNKDLKSWRESLTKVANLSGWDCKDRPEAKLIETVVEELGTKLCSKLPPYFEDLIGIENKIEQLDPLLEIGLNDVRFVGIWGLPGVGKTTIARAVFDKYHRQFEIKCFLHNVRATSERDGGEVHLQSKLISHLKIRNMEIEDIFEGNRIIQKYFRDKKVLLILDDVSHTRHLEILANSPNWFGAGSRVIMTTRDSGLLRRVHEVYVHEVKTMDPDESLQLFCSKAFKRGEPLEDLLEMSKTVCVYVKGLPLALSILGSFLCGRSSMLEWEDALDMLKKNLHDDILRVFKLSFDALNGIEQAIFLDIACFFNGWSKKVITHLLESCGFNAKIGIATLREKSMLKVYDDCLVMHDLLEQMGRRIVVDKSPNDVENRSRLWSKEDIDNVMKNKRGTKKIQGMVSSTSCEASWDPNAFSKFHNLILLIITSDFNLPDGLQCLSHALKVLHWTKYPLDTLPPQTGLDELVDLKMCHSKLKKLWNKSLCSRNLKFLDLSYSQNLIETPDFSKLPNLERLELEGCEALVDLHASIGQHKKVQVLNLKGCKNLRARCPKKFEMSALKEFVLCGCIQVKYLPEFGESMKNLEMLDVGETNLVKLPESLGLLSGLKTLRLKGCKNLVFLPQSIHKLKRLVLVDIAGCSKFARLPEKLNEMEALEEIDASETDITEVPCSISGLKNVKKLSFRGYKRSTSNSWSWIRPLKRALFWGQSIPKGLTVPASIWSIKSLNELDLSYCNIVDGSIPFDLGGLSSLKKLDLSGNLFKNLPIGCMSNLLKLEYLYLNLCSELQSLPQLGPRVYRMDAKECGSMETVVDEQIFHFFASINQAENPRKGELFTMTIPGSEIPSWFENQIDLCLNDEGEASIMIEVPPCGEEMLGIGLCVVLDNDKFYSTGPNKRCFSWPCWWVDSVLNVVPIAVYRLDDVEMKSSHLWIVLLTPKRRRSRSRRRRRRELHHILQLSKRSQLPLTLRFYGKKVDTMKCGWRVISKADFGNCTCSMSQ